MRCFRNLVPILILGSSLAFQVPSAHAAQEGQKPPTPLLLHFYAVPTKEVFLRGEPVFLKATLRNDGDNEQVLRMPPRIQIATWLLEVGKKGEPLRRIDLSTSPHDAMLGAPVRLAPGEEMVDYVTLWFAPYGDVPEEWSLIFKPPGTFRYNVALILGVDTDGQHRESLRLACEGEVNVGTKTLPGLTPMVRCLREICVQQEFYVSPMNRPRLEALIDELGDSPYAKYAKWVWIRSVRMEPEVGKGGWLFTAGTQEAKRTIEQLDKRTSDILADPTAADTPLVWDALSARAWLNWGLHEKEKKDQALKELEKKIAPLKLPRDGEQWMY
jgi:hypothetical protein